MKLPNLTLNHLGAESFIRLINKMPRDAAMQALKEIKVDTKESLKKLMMDVVNISDKDVRKASLLLEKYQGKTTLHVLASTRGAVAKMLCCLDKERRIDALMARDDGGNTVFNLMETGDVVSVLSQLPQDKLLAVINARNGNYTPILKELTSYPDLFPKVLMLLPEEQRLEALMTLDEGGDGGVRLHYAANQCPQSLLAALRTLHETQRLDALIAGRCLNVDKTYQYQRVIGCVAKNHPQHVVEMLGLLPVSQLNNLPDDVLKIPEVKAFVEKAQLKNTNEITQQYKAEIKIVTAEISPTDLPGESKSRP